MPKRTPRVPKDRRGMIRVESAEDVKFREGIIHITFEILESAGKATIENDDIFVSDVLLDDTHLIKNVVLCKGRNIENGVRGKTDKKFLHIHVKVKSFCGKANL